MNQSASDQVATWYAACLPYWRQWQIQPLPTFAEFGMFVMWCGYRGMPLQQAAPMEAAQALLFWRNETAQNQQLAEQQTLADRTRYEQWRREQDAVAAYNRQKMLEDEQNKQLDAVFGQNSTSKGELSYRWWRLREWYLKWRQRMRYSSYQKLFKVAYQHLVKTTKNQKANRQIWYDLPIGLVLILTAVRLFSAGGSWTLILALVALGAAAILLGTWFSALRVVIGLAQEADNLATAEIRRRKAQKDKAAQQQASAAQATTSAAQQSAPAAPSQQPQPTPQQ